MQGVLNNLSKTHRSRQTSQKQKHRPCRPKLLQLLQHMQVQAQLRAQENHWVRKKRPRHHVSSIKCHQVACMVPNVRAVIRKPHPRSRKVTVAQIQNQSLRLRQLQLPRFWRRLPYLLQPCFSHSRLGRLSGLRIQVLEDILTCFETLSGQGYTTVLWCFSKSVSRKPSFLNRWWPEGFILFHWFSRSEWPIWENQSLYLGLMPHGSVDWTWHRTKWT